jgi:hypothetical protein
MLIFYLIINKLNELLEPIFVVLEIITFSIQQLVLI